MCPCLDSNDNLGPFLVPKVDITSDGKRNDFIDLFRTQGTTGIGTIRSETSASAQQMPAIEERLRRSYSKKGSIVQIFNFEVLISQPFLFRPPKTLNSKDSEEKEAILPRK